MLKLLIPKTEFWDEQNQEFIQVNETTLNLEHSLVSLSKWESKWKKPFLTNNKKTKEEYLDYIRFMTTNQNLNPRIFDCLSKKHFDQIDSYINDPMTATTFSDTQKKGKNEIITAEIIYFWMINYQIPFECQKWHINRLLTLIRVCSIKSSPQKKMSTRDIMARNKSLNDARKAKMKTKG